MDANRRSATATPVSQVMAGGRRQNARVTHSQMNASNVNKTVSEVSMTPSQAEQAKKDRKNPLDALSRSTVGQHSTEKRCGLQDVDEDYLKNNVFAKPSFAKHTGLDHPAQGYGQRTVVAAAGHPTQMNRVQAGGGDATPTAQAVGETEVLRQQQQQAQVPQYQQRQAAGYVQSIQPAQVHQTQISPESTQKVQKASAQVTPNQGQQNRVICQPQIQQEIPQQIGAPTGLSQMSVPQAQQTNSVNAANVAQQQPVGGAVMAEPDICTTCPNCQTTIYLVREANFPSVCGVSGNSPAMGMQGQYDPAASGGQIN